VVRRVTSFEAEPIRWDRPFESRSLQRRVRCEPELRFSAEERTRERRVDCEPDSLDQGGDIASLPDSLPLDWAGAQNNLGNALAALPLSRRLGGATGSLIARPNPQCGCGRIAARFAPMPHARGVRSPYEDRTHGSGICSADSALERAGFEPSVPPSDGRPLISPRHAC
jgi:hypothetical protein